jgi:hypothetical protein
MKYILITLLLVNIISGCSQSTEANQNNLEELNLKGSVNKISTTTYEGLNHNGSITKGGLLKKESTLTFNNVGNIIERENYGHNGSFQSKSELEYASRGNHVGSTVYNLNGEVLTIFEISYDDSNNPVESIAYNSDKKLKYKFTSIYDKNGNMTEENLYNSDGSLNSNDTYKYDKNGNVKRNSKKSKAYKVKKMDIIIEKTPTYKTIFKG